MSKETLQILANAGIDDTEALDSVAAFVREHPFSKPMVGALSLEEENYLIEAGAVGVKSQNKQHMINNVTQMASEYAVLVETALSQKSVSQNLNVTTSRIRQRIDSGSLYAIQLEKGRVCPAWQFYEGRTLPGLEQVLSVIDKSVNPLVIQRFFTTVSADLESDKLGTVLTPRDWLITGHDVNEVMLLAESL